MIKEKMSSSAYENAVKWCLDGADPCLRGYALNSTDFSSECAARILSIMPKYFHKKPDEALQYLLLSSIYPHNSDAAQQAACADTVRHHLRVTGKNNTLFHAEALRALTGLRGYSDICKELAATLAEKQKPSGAWHESRFTGALSFYIYLLTGYSISRAGLPCLATTLAALKALQRYSSHQTSEYHDTLQKGAHYLLNHGAPPAGKKLTYPLRFLSRRNGFGSYSLLYGYDEADRIELLIQTGHHQDPRVISAVNRLLESRNSDGTWSLTFLHRWTHPLAAAELMEDGKSRWLTWRNSMLLKKIDQLSKA